MRNERVNQADQKHFLLTIFSEVSLLLQTAVICRCKFEDLTPVMSFTTSESSYGDYSGNLFMVQYRSFALVMKRLKRGTLNLRR
jgi:hypothetical protein